MQRRGFLAGIFAAGMAPAFVGAKVLMPVRQIATPELFVFGPVSYESDAFSLVMEPMTPSEIARVSLQMLGEQIQFSGSVGPGWEIDLQKVKIQWGESPNLVRQYARA